MILLYQTHSPYARKALVFAHEVGLADAIEVVHHETSPTLRNNVVFVENSVGKVPVLLRNGRPPIFGSDVICAYFGTLHDGAKLIPPYGEARWAALRMQAVAQGMADAGIAIRWETVRRPEGLRFPALAEGYREKLETSYDWLDRAVGKMVRFTSAMWRSPPSWTGLDSATFRLSAIGRVFRPGSASGRSAPP